MRIAYISDTNPSDINNWSGVAETVGDAFENNAGGEFGVWAGGIAGEYATVKLGALIGSSVGPGGAAIGAIVGAIIGGIGGSIAGSDLGSKVGSYIVEIGWE